LETKTKGFIKLAVLRRSVYCNELAEIFSSEVTLIRDQVLINVGAYDPQTDHTSTQ